MKTNAFTLLGYSTALKNALEKEFFEFLKYRSNRLVDARREMADVEFKAQELSKKHPRCKPLKIHFHTWADEQTHHLNGFPAIFQIFLIKRED